MARTTLPLFPTDDGWPYPDIVDAMDPGVDDDLDLDALELRADPHAFSMLTPAELLAVTRRFGLDGTEPVSVKQLGDALGCSRAEARDLLGCGIDKLRDRLRDT
jgi:DNA-directed RNA polymerase sigma subunit (sigma70/sigma32)